MLDPGLISEVVTLDAVDSIHRRPADEDRFMDLWLSLPDVNNLSLANVVGTIDALAPFNEIINLCPVPWLIVTTYSSNAGGIVEKRVYGGWRCFCKSLVKREWHWGQSIQPWGAPVLVVIQEEMSIYTVLAYSYWLWSDSEEVKGSLA